MIAPLHRTARWILLGSLFALAACSAREGYPSLEPRPIERGGVPGLDAAPTSAPAPVAASDAALDRQVAALVQQAVTGNAAFQRTAEQACDAAARGKRAAEGSEAWISAQQLLSAVDGARAPTQSALAELDRLVIERGTGDGAAVDLSRLAAAQEQVSTLDMAEQARVAALSGGSCGR